MQTGFVCVCGQLFPFVRSRRIIRPVRQNSLKKHEEKSQSLPAFFGGVRKDSGNAAGRGRDAAGHAEGRQKMTGK